MTPHGNPNRFRTPAQLAHLTALRAKFKDNRGRPRKQHPEPFGRAPSRGPIGPMIKTVDGETQALIDAALRVRAGAAPSRVKPGRVPA